MPREPKVRHFAVRLDETEACSLDFLAALYGKTPSDVMRSLLIEAWQREAAERECQDASSDGAEGAESKITATNDPVNEGMAQ